MTNWFTADYHFSHLNIIKYSQRPFKDLSHMKEVIIKNHNSRVKPEDFVYFLGDWGTPKENFRETLARMNGHFIFIQGNHDYNNDIKTILHSGIIKIGGQLVYLVHRPDDYEPSFPINLVGHVHNLWKIKELKDGTILFNVGIDQNNFYPIKWIEIEKEITEWKKTNKEKK